ncbi:lysophospholipid acyltransferase family protein [Niabella beijingensis]|uniref:lysophospholipid acyltransferase family protein n=1 Tax=Niabella beijingensis TaxID=2872700 RepID=UPI001CBBAF13|nr:lysophospholipid acyltransferase family protein [Niabella beijingensis]MBZ4192609.1 lysophospholipid acyltransferase family protein [Niabella beijingensis]
MKKAINHTRQTARGVAAGGKQRSLTYLLTALLIYLCSLLPFTVLYAVAGLIYFLFFRLLKYRYAVVFQNLSRSFPQMSYREIDAVASRFYRHFSKLLVEVVKLMSISESELKTRLHLRNPELIEYYHRQNRPVIAMMGHCGNWECLSILPRYFTSQVYAVYRPLSNKGMNRLLLYIRSRFGMKLLPMLQAPRYMLQHKQDPALYLFIADQSPDPDARCRVEFMHQSTLMFNGAEKLARATGAAVVYLELNRTSEKHWEVSFSLVAENPSAMPVHEITRVYAHKLQQTICKTPDQWLWTHKRWKHKAHTV